MAMNNIALDEREYDLSNGNTKKVTTISNEIITVKIEQECTAKLSDDVKGEILDIDEQMHEQQIEDEAYAERMAEMAEDFIWCNY
jgi:hypothetical protein